ncbi:MAG: hypothetical protein IPJ66_00715 [Bacteroidetes bacterium]|nr:hypothetical protein [Bacteroidota bacterium]MBL0064710.1 hypothetical protein [Bacteroidota bacterium]
MGNMLLAIGIIQVGIATIGFIAFNPFDVIQILIVLISIVLLYKLSRKKEIESEK